MLPLRPSFPSLRTLSLHRVPPAEVSTLPDTLREEVRKFHVMSPTLQEATACTRGDIWIVVRRGEKLRSFIDEIVASGQEWAVCALSREFYEDVEGESEVDWEDRMETREFFPLKIIFLGSLFFHRHLIERFLPERSWEEDVREPWFHEVSSTKVPCIWDLKATSKNVGLTFLAIMEGDVKTLSSFPLGTLDHHTILNLAYFSAVFRRPRSLEYLLQFCSWEENGVMNRILSRILERSLREDDLEMYRILYESFCSSNARRILEFGGKRFFRKEGGRGDHLLAIVYGAEKIFFHYAHNLRTVEDYYFQSSINPQITRWLYEKFPQHINPIYALLWYEGEDAPASGLLSLLGLR